MPTTSQVGTAGKLDAHQRGLKHRAISVLVRNSDGEFLLQRRSPAKYHSGGLWTNACCSHPLPGESTADAARRRLAQEMGFACPIDPLFVFHYNTPVPGGLIENELVHVFGGRHDGPIKPDPAEVSEWKWIALRRSDGRHARAPGRLHRLVPAICRHARRHAGELDRAQS